MDVIEFASSGGSARAKKLSKERRLEISKNANAAKAAKKADKKPEEYGRYRAPVDDRVVIGSARKSSK